MRDLGSCLTGSLILIGLRDRSLVSMSGRGICLGFRFISLTIGGCGFQFIFLGCLGLLALSRIGILIACLEFFWLFLKLIRLFY